jgi:hypothetical protein
MGGHILSAFGLRNADFGALRFVNAAAMLDGKTSILCSPHQRRVESSPVSEPTSE